MATETDPPGISRDTLEAVIAKTPFAKFLGAEVQTYTEGEVILSVPVKPELKQHHGFVHGAVIGFIADSACAWAAASVAGDVVTSGYQLELLKPAVGDTLFGHGKVVSASKRQVICRCDVFSSKNGVQTLVAIGQATIMKV